MPFRPELPQRHLDLHPLSHLAPNRKVTDRAQRAPQNPREKSLSAAILVIRMRLCPTPQQPATVVVVTIRVNIDNFVRADSYRMFASPRAQS
jgi:hypothetical protein